jgi:hypothetical protein
MNIILNLALGRKSWKENNYHLGGVEVEKTSFIQIMGSDHADSASTGFFIGPGIG